MPFSTLISSKELAENLDRADWVIIDCRFDLANPHWGFDDYQRAHIPGAVYASLNNDLSAPISSESGRHPLPDQGLFFSKLSEWGVDSTRQVIVYDTSGGSYAGRLWWMLRLFGHSSAAVLDGGFQNWVAENHPVETGIHKNNPAHFTGQFHPDMLVSAEDVERLRLDPGYRLIDARAPERYRGDIEPLDTAAGHIPGAVNRFYGENLTPSGKMKPDPQLRQEFDQLISGVDPDHVIVYCGSGVTSAHHILAMEKLGLAGARLYVGSWSHWIRDPKRPQAKGQ